MKTPTIVLAAALVAANTFANARADTAVGVRDIAIAVPARGHDITATLWYPAAAGGQTVNVGENGVFAGASGHQDAASAPGRFPVIVLSHGGLRAAPNQDSWLASRLAAKGFVVAVPHPPGPQQLAASDAPAELWLRPADMSATLTALEHDSVLAGKIDTGNAGALGLLRGGTSALALAGARLDGQAYAQSCDGPASNADCAWFAKHNVNLNAIDTASIEASHRDRRFISVVAVAPELAEVFTPQSLAAIAVPVLQVELGAGPSIAIPGAQFEPITMATHFDVFNECKPKGILILREEGGDEALCADGPMPRANVHEKLAEMIAEAFDHPEGGGL